MRFVLTIVTILYCACTVSAQDAADPQLAISNFNHDLNRPITTSSVRFIRFDKLDAAKKKSIEEDSSVLSYMISKGMNLVTPRSALGVTVPQYNGKSEITYNDHGLTLIYNVPYLLVDDRTKSNATANETLTPWQKAKLEMSAKRQGQDFYALRTTWNSNYAKPSFDKGVVDALKKQIANAVENAGNFRDLESDDSITVLVYGNSYQTGHRAVLGWKVNMADFSDGKIKSAASIKTVEYTELARQKSTNYGNLTYPSTPRASIAPSLTPNQITVQPQALNPLLKRPKDVSPPKANQSGK